MFMIMNETLKPGEAQHMHFGRNVPAADRTQAGREFHANPANCPTNRADLRL